MIDLDPVPRPIDHLPARGRPGDVAIEDRAGTVSYAEVEARVGATAAWLARQGLNPGDRVASWLPKTRLACVMPLAAPRAGLNHVPVNPVPKRAKVAHILPHNAAPLAVTQPARGATFATGELSVTSRIGQGAKVWRHGGMAGAAGAQPRRPRGKLASQDAPRLRDAARGAARGADPCAGQSGAQARAGRPYPRR